MELLLKGLSFYQWILLIIGALFIGMSKTGISGAGMAFIPIMAIVFGGRQSSGVVLPMLCFADIIAVLYYHTHTNWDHIKKLLPPALTGILFGTYIGRMVTDDVFKEIMALIVIISVCYIIWRDIKNDIRIPTGYLFPIIIGFSGGFATMMGNAAGAIMSVYLLSMRMSKNEYIGTGAWFFLIINLFKVPFHLLFWGTITSQTFLINLILLPVLLIGGLTGILIIKIFPERAYRIFLIITTIISALIIVL